MSPEMREAVQAGWRRLDADPRGHLELGPRRRIYAALGLRVRDADGRPVRTPGYLRRVAPAMRTARFVLPLWERARPDDREPHRLLDLIPEHVAGQVDFLSLHDAIDTLAVWLGGVEHRADRESGSGFWLLAGCAVVSAGSFALTDGPIVEDRADEGVRDEGDYYEWDTAYRASLAFGGGHPGRNRNDPKKRREFWAWYLTKAVPEAWAAGGQ